MYNAIWKKYLSIIRILLKRAATEDQNFQMNVSDFEKTGPQKKAGFNFTLKFKKGRVDDLASLSIIAKEFSSVLLQDPQINELLQTGEYHLQMNGKFLLHIKAVDKLEMRTELFQHAEALV